MPRALTVDVLPDAAKPVMAWFFHGIVADRD
jgi:hypothetical protein